MPKCIATIKLLSKSPVYVLPKNQFSKRKRTEQERIRQDSQNCSEQTPLLILATGPVLVFWTQAFDLGSMGLLKGLETYTNRTVRQSYLCSFG